MKTTLDYKYKKRLVAFLNRYKEAKNATSQFMQKGDINSYLNKLIESEQAKQEALNILSQC